MLSVFLILIRTSEGNVRGGYFFLMSQYCTEIIFQGTETSFKGGAFLLMGLLLLVSAFGIITLPETTAMKLLATIEEAEAFGAANSIRKRMRASSVFKKLVRSKSFSTPVKTLEELVKSS